MRNIVEKTVVTDLPEVSDANHSEGAERSKLKNIYDEIADALPNKLDDNPHGWTIGFDGRERVAGVNIGKYTAEEVFGENSSVEKYLGKNITMYLERVKPSGMRDIRNIGKTPDQDKNVGYLVIETTVDEKLPIASLGYETEQLGHVTRALVLSQNGNLEAWKSAQILERWGTKDKSHGSTKPVYSIQHGTGPFEDVNLWSKARDFIVSNVKKT